MNEAITIICGSTLLFGVVLLIIFGFFSYLRWVRYKETLALAEKGLLARPERGNGGKGTLRWGIVITALGVALCVGLYPIGFTITTRNEFPLNFGPWMLFGLIPTFFGLALLLIYYLTMREGRPEKPAPPAAEPKEDEPH